MDRELIKQVLLEQQAIRLPVNFVSRQLLPKITSLMAMPFVVVIMGMRRCGKSTVMQWLRSQSTENNYYFNFDDDRLADFQLADFQTLYELLLEIYGKQQTFFFDELQLIPQWERFIRRLHDHGNKVYITGSNATMFSRELGTRLTGRYLAVTLYPYSFVEYLQSQHVDIASYQPTSQMRAQLRRLFSQYLEHGGIPEYIQHTTIEYLHTLFENIVYKDILVRYHLTQEKVIRSLLVFLASNVAKNITFNSLKKLTPLSNSNTIAEYCHYFQNSFLCFIVNRYSASLKQQHGYAKKIYWIDTALASKVGFRFSEDRGRMLENVVYLELLRRECEVYFYHEHKECDFIIKVQHRIVRAIQVTASLQNPTTRAREIAGLVEAMAAFNLSEGLIISDNEAESFEHQAAQQVYHIEVIPIWQWLLVTSPKDITYSTARLK